MAKSCFTTPIQASNTLHHSKTHMFITHIQTLFYTLLCNTFYSHTIHIELTDTDNYLPPDDPNITNLMVSHHDCEKQHQLRQFNLLNVKSCTEAPSNIQHAKVRARVFVRAKAKRVKAFKCEAYDKIGRKICFQGSAKYRRVDRTVWNHNALPLPITLDPIECKHLIRHLNSTNKKILNNSNYNRTFTPLEDPYFQEILEQYQTPPTVYNSEVELTYDDTENLMVIDGHGLPCFLLTVFVNPLLKLLSPLFGLVTTLV